MEKMKLSAELERILTEKMIFILEDLFTEVLMKATCNYDDNSAATIRHKNLLEAYLHCHYVMLSERVEPHDETEEIVNNCNIFIKSLTMLGRSEMKIKLSNGQYIGFGYPDPNSERHLILGKYWDFVEFSDDNIKKNFISGHGFEYHGLRFLEWNHLSEAEQNVIRHFQQSSSATEPKQSDGVEGAPSPPPDAPPQTVATTPATDETGAATKCAGGAEVTVPSRTANATRINQLNALKRQTVVNAAMRSIVGLMPEWQKGIPNQAKDTMAKYIKTAYLTLPELTDDEKIAIGKLTETQIIGEVGKPFHFIGGSPSTLRELTKLIGERIPRG